MLNGYNKARDIGKEIRPILFKKKIKKKTENTIGFN